MGDMDLLIDRMNEENEYEEYEEMCKAAALRDLEEEEERNYEQEGWDMAVEQAINERLQK